MVFRGILLYKYFDIFRLEINPQFSKHVHSRHRLSVFNALIGRSICSAVNCYLYSVGPVHFMIGNNRFTRAAPCTNHIFDYIHAHSVCLQKPQFILPTMRKRSKLFEMLLLLLF